VARGQALSDDDDTRVSYLAGEANGPLPTGERASMDRLRGLLATPAVWVEPPATLEMDVVAAVVQAAQLRAPRRTAPRRRAGRMWLAFPPVRAVGISGMAAAAVAAIVIGLASLGSRGGPERLAMVVSGTALAPHAHGRATLLRTPSGWEVQLSVAGLPRIARGRYYEAWLRDATGEQVAIGTFNDARRVTLWAGVSPTTFSTLTVTVQRLGAGLAASGTWVLTGAVGTRASHRP